MVAALYIQTKSQVGPDSSEKPDGALESGLELPDKGVNYVTVGGVTHEAWRVPYNTLTAQEKEWLVSQKGLRYGGLGQKPVAWSELGLRMFYEAKRLGDRDRFRPLFTETLGAAWNFKEWRFPGQNDEFPIFTKEINWTKWLKTGWGQRWVAGVDRLPQDKMPRT
jgi:hypothetical protein